MAVKGLKMGMKCFLHGIINHQMVLFQTVVLQKVGKGHGEQFLQLHHLMINIKICICLPTIFALSLTISEITIVNF